MTRPKWTENEVKILRKHYSTTGPKLMTKRLPCRTWQAILTKAKMLGLRVQMDLKSVSDARVMARGNIPWDDAQDDLLERMYPHADWDELMSAFPGRSHDGIQGRACKIGVKRGKVAMRRPVEKEVICQEDHFCYEVKHVITPIGWVRGHDIGVRSVFDLGAA